MSRAGATWTENEEAELVAGFELGKSVEELSAEFQRTPDAIVSRLVHLEYLVVVGNAYHAIERHPWVTFAALKKLKARSTT